MTMTPKDFREISLQEIFDHSTRGIIEQGGPCIEPSTQKCLYTFEGKHCAAGWVLLDTIEGQSVKALVLTMYGEVPSMKIKLLEELQSCHDGAAYEAKWATGSRPKAFWKNWKSALEKLVHDFHVLDDSVLREIPDE